MTQLSEHKPSRRTSGLFRGGRWKAINRERRDYARQALPILTALEASFAIEPGTNAVATLRDCIDLCKFWADEE